MEKNYRLKKLFVLLFLVTTFFISLKIGKYPIKTHQFLDILLGQVSTHYSVPETIKTVLFKVRLPRIIAALLIGTALSASGAAYQGVFRNPLVSPDILGASAGASFGACLGILFSFDIVRIQLLSFTFGIIAVFFTYLISKQVSNSDSTLVLILAGMLVGTLFTSFVSLTKFLADPYDKLPAITFWLMGSLASINKQDILILLPCVIIGIIPIYLLRWKLNVLSLGEEEARTMGISTEKLRVIIIICSTLMTSTSVAVGGLIGWVGLIIPHLARALVGPNYKKLLPISIFLGSTYLLLVDDLARCIVTVEFPLGILTSIIGAPFFIYLLIYSRKGWV